MSRNRENSWFCYKKKKHPIQTLLSFTDLQQHLTQNKYGLAWFKTQYFNCVISSQIEIELYMFVVWKCTVKATYLSWSLVSFAWFFLDRNLIKSPTNILSNVCEHILDIYRVNVSVYKPCCITLQACMRMGWWGLSTDLRLETYKNIIIDVFWVTDYFLVKQRQMKCPGQLLTSACVIIISSQYDGKDFILRV